MPTDPCTLDESPWCVLTDSLDSALYMLARALALDRQYDEFCASQNGARHAHIRKSARGRDQGKEKGRKWYLAMHTRPSLQDRLARKPSAPLIVNAADALRAWEEVMQYGTKSQMVRAHRRAAEVGDVYLCWTGGKFDTGERGVVRPDVMSGREIEGVRTMSEWRCTEFVSCHACVSSCEEDAIKS
jgi:ferredoxin